MSPKPVVGRRVLGCGLVIALVLGLYAASIVQTSAIGSTAPQPEAPSPSPSNGPVGNPCTPPNCTGQGGDISTCWCPTLQLGVEPSDLTVFQATNYEFFLTNSTAAPVRVIDTQGRLVADIPPGLSWQLGVPGPGTYLFTLGSPLTQNQARLEVDARQN